MQLGQKRFKRRRLIRGVALLEAVVGLFILAFSALSVFALSIYSTKISRQSEARAAALSIARTKIDEILAVSQSNRKPVTDEPVAIAADLKALMPEGTSTAAVYTVRNVSGTKNLQEIIVTIKWRNRTGSGTNAPMTSVSASKVVSTVLNMDWVGTDGWNQKPIDQLFYTPPPPAPKPTTTTTTTGGSSGGSSGSSSSTGSTTGSSSSSSSSGGSSNSSSGGSSTGSSSTGSSTTGSTPAPTYTGFGATYGSKWK